MTFDGTPANTRQQGIVNVPVEGGRSGVIAMTFPHAFTAVPTVVVSSRDGFYHAASNSETTTGVLIGVTQLDGTFATRAVAVNWIATI